MSARYKPRLDLTPDARRLCDALRAEIVVAGWSATARRAGVDRMALHRAFPPVRRGRNPSFPMVAEVARSLGFELTLTRKGPQ